MDNPFADLDEPAAVEAMWLAKECVRDVVSAYASV